MTIYLLADNLSLRVGRRGVWIWAPSVSRNAIHLDRGTLMEMGLRLSGSGDPVEVASPSNSHAAIWLDEPNHES